ncbi:hypothetical protein [Streptomyces sp. NPDC004685]
MNALTARQGIFNYLTGRAVCKVPRSVDEAEGILQAYRAEVLREAADFVGNDDDCDCGGCDSCVPRKLADGLRVLAVEKATAAAATATPPLSDRLAALLAAIHAQGGEWSTAKVQALYRKSDPVAPLRATARKDLHALHAMGHLVQHDERGRQFYTFNTAPAQGDQ